MKKQLIMALLVLHKAYSTFTVGYTSYNSSFTTQTKQINGTLSSFVTALSSTNGPVGIMTYNLPPSYSSNPQYSTALSSFLFKSALIIEQPIYVTNSFLSMFQTQGLSSLTALSFIEKTGSSQRIISGFLNAQTGLFSLPFQQAFNYQNYPFSQITLGGANNNSLIVNALSGPYANGLNQLYNTFGGSNGFSYNPVNIVGPFSNPLNLASTSNSQVTTTAFCQNNYGIVSTSYIRQTSSGNSDPVRLTDSLQKSCNFLSFNSSGNVLFFADTTTIGTTRLAACDVGSNGVLSNPNYLSCSYSYNPAIPLTFASDQNQNQYLIFNGVATVYSNNCLQIGIFNSNTRTWKGFISGPPLFISNTNACQATPFNKGLMLVELSNGLAFTTSTTTNSNGQISSTSTPVVVTGYNLSSAILNNTSYSVSTITMLNSTSPGSNTLSALTPFYSPPSYSSIVDSTGNVIFAFSGNTQYNYLLFSNVYLNDQNAFTGQKLVNGYYNSASQISAAPSITFYNTSTPPSSISAPILYSQSGQIICVWSQNQGGNYTIYGAVYNPSQLSFSSPTLLASGFSSMPSIIPVSGGNGVIFAGNN